MQVKLCQYTNRCYYKLDSQLFVPGVCYNGSLEFNNHTNIHKIYINVNNLQIPNITMKLCTLYKLKLQKIYIVQNISFLF